jgi:anthraniloyl-CoA monooxygenase
MDINIVGAGPGGLFFSYLVKKRFTDWKIRVFERNAPDATYGWGVVFSEVALSFLEKSDRAFFQRFKAGHVESDHMEIVHRGVHVPLRGNRFSRVARLSLLQFLHAECQAVGVDLVFETSVDRIADVQPADIVVIADGVNSRLRSEYQDVFRPSFVQRRNKFAWYGTQKLFYPVSLIFRSTPVGVFIAHCYQYSDSLSTFLIETDPETWERAGLSGMSDVDSRAYCERVFAEDLAGHGLLSNKSSWFEAVTVKNEKWSHGNTVLLGDALRSVHFSLGSGTRMAMEDAIGLFEGVCAHQNDVGQVFAHFETARRNASDRFQLAAAKSLDWYENVSDKLHLEPVGFAYDYMRRTGRVTHEDLRKRDPELALQHERLYGAPADAA